MDFKQHRANAVYLLNNIARIKEDPSVKKQNVL